MCRKQEWEDEPQQTEWDVWGDNKLQISKDLKRLRCHFRKQFQRGLVSEFSESLCYLISHNHILVTCKVKGKKLHATVQAGLENSCAEKDQRESYHDGP